MVFGTTCLSLRGQATNQPSLAPPPDAPAPKTETKTGAKPDIAPQNLAAPRVIKVGDAVLVTITVEGSTEKKQLAFIDGLEISDGEFTTKWEMKNGVNTPSTTQTFWIKALRPGDYIIQGYDNVTYHSEGSVTAMVHSHLETLKLHVAAPPPTPTPVIHATSGID